MCLFLVLNNKLLYPYTLTASLYDMYITDIHNTSLWSTGNKKRAMLYQRTSCSLSYTEIKITDNAHRNKTTIDTT